MKLTENFHLDEFLVSETAERMGIDNDPPDDVIDNLRGLASTLEEVRKVLGNRPITITSGYRSPNLNRAVNGSRKPARAWNGAFISYWPFVVSWTVFRGRFIWPSRIPVSGQSRYI